MLASTHPRPGELPPAPFACVAGVMLAGCGINTIPTLQEQAKAAWSQVLNQYQRRADLIPNLVETVKGFAAQESKVLTDVVEARAKATQVQIPPDILTNPEAFQKFQEAQNNLTGALGRLLVDRRELSGPEVEPELPGAPVAARRHREPHRHRAAGLHHRGQGLQYRDQDDPRPLVARAALSRRRAHAELHRGGRHREAAGGQVLASAPSGGPQWPLVRRFGGVVLAMALALVARRPLAAAPTFPELTGRVVDDADLLSYPEEVAITADLKALEDKSSDQVVVVTLPSLQGYTIEDFGYQLGRHWGIGTAKLRQWRPPHRRAQ